MTFSCFDLDVNRLFPNFNVFIKVVLKREILSEDAECIRARYEGIISAMEDDHAPPRPISLIGDDDSGYHSTKPKGSVLCHIVIMYPDLLFGVCLHVKENKWSLSWQCARMSSLVPCSTRACYSCKIYVPQ